MGLVDEEDVAVICESLSKYRYESGGNKSQDYAYWILTDEMEYCIKHFRSAVVNKAEDFVRIIIANLVAEEHADKLTALLLDSPRLEPWKEALLTAISLGSRPLVEFILPLFCEFPGEEYKACKNSFTYPSHITPLTLACICNNFAIVECLLLRGHQIVLPHRADCSCSECGNRTPSLSTKLVRLDTYKAICSDAFLWLACTDPLLAACQLSKDLEVNLICEQEHKKCYQRLYTSVMTFSLNFVEQCWGPEEINVLLAQKQGVTVAECDIQLPRVRLALDSHMKYFLSSLGVQNAVKHSWIADWNNYKDQAVGIFLGAVKHTVCYPLFAAVHAFSAGSCVQSFSCPRARYLSTLTSYFAFLLVLLYLRFPGRVGKDALNRSLVRQPLDLMLEGYVYLYALGMLANHYLGLFYRGMRRFYEMWWRWFDVIFFWLFFGSAFCFIMSTAAVEQDGLAKLHRKHWVFYDFSIVYDIYFGGACIMAFWRVFYFVQLNRSIGLKVISIGQCVYPVVTFLWIMGVVTLCFSIGINMIYEAYSDNKAITDAGEAVRMKDTFSSVLFTCRILYWAFYGYLGPWDYTLVVGNAGPEGAPAHHLFTVLAGEVIVGIYHITVILGLVNLMISFLVRTTENIQRNEDIEWKYTRCHIYTEFLEWYAAVPPPFNLVYVFLTLCRRFFQMDAYACVWPDLAVRWEFLEYDPRKLVEEEQEYEVLLMKLFGRYRNWIKEKFAATLRLDADDVLSSTEEQNIIPDPVFAFMTKEAFRDNAGLDSFNRVRDLQAEQYFDLGAAQVQRDSSVFYGPSRSVSTDSQTETLTPGTPPALTPESPIFFSSSSAEFLKS